MTEKQFLSMKTSILKTVLTTLALLLSIGNICSQNKGEVRTIEIDSNWQFANEKDTIWRSASMPSCVHKELIAHKLIPHPYYGENEKLVQWIENENWQYRTTFNLTKEDVKNEHTVLCFEGLDTYCDVYLNGSKILSADNMFVEHKCDVTGLLKEGENRLFLNFFSPIKHLLGQHWSNGFNYPEGNDKHEKRMSIFTRKAPYSYGWDWGIRLTTSGIWRPVKLKFYNKADIGTMLIAHKPLSDDKWIENIKIDNINSRYDNDTKGVIKVERFFKDKLESSLTKNVTLKKDAENSLAIIDTLSNVKVWQPREWGQPNLYKYVFTLSVDGKEVSKVVQERIGVRTVRLVRDRDKTGEMFYFEVNGKPFFAKGANYIPQDAMLPLVTKERHRQLMDNVMFANMNMIRVWGGGTYEDDYFYDLAAENGLLIWQDFMFACTPYPADKTFISRIEKEAEYNIKRLRNNPSIAFFCGNNEIDEALKYWGIDKSHTKEEHQSMFVAYDKIFNDVLKKQVEKYAPQYSYIPTSPLYSTWGRPDTWLDGDSHNWGVWYGRKDFESFQVEIPRFMSEYGFQSFPEMKTIKTFASKESDWDIESAVMKHHQKSSIGNEVIKQYMERYYVVPDKFEDFVYVNQVMQGRGMCLGIESHRVNRPYCMGSLYWQLNDSWPVVSWSSVDYYNNYKAMHYYVRDVCAPLMVTMQVTNGKFATYICNDNMKTISGAKVDIDAFDFNGKKLKHIATIDGIEVEENNTQKIMEKPVEELSKGLDKSFSYLLATLKDKQGRVLSKKHIFLSKVKDLNLPNQKVDLKLVKVFDGGFTLRVKSKSLVKDLFIETPYQGAEYNDNYFDLLPNETKLVTIKTSEITRKSKPEYKTLHMAEINAQKAK